MRRRRRKPPQSNHDRWLVSYSDFITLLFAFFVVLYATSRADMRKQAQFAHAIHSAFSALSLFPSKGHDKLEAQVSVPPQAKTSASVEQDLMRIQKNLDHTLSAQVAAHTVAVQLGPSGLVISLRQAGFYQSGSATPRSSSIATIGKIAQELRPTPYALRIEGHTDNVPIHTAQYASNWDLSTARATYMTELFITKFNFNPARLSAAGYAQYHPIASNATAAGRAKNRRVDIIVLPHGYITQPLPAQSGTATADKTSTPTAPSASTTHKPSPSTAAAVASTQTQKPSPGH
jgi:chemotaxis protein MotB